MTKTPDDQAPKAQKEAPKPQVSPEAEVSARVAELQAKLAVIKQEVQTIHGKFINRDPGRTQELQKENQGLKARLVLLEKAYFALLADGFQPRQADQADLKVEVLRKSAIDYFKKTKVDEGLWKNIES